MSNIIPANVQVPAHIAARMRQGSSITDQMVGTGGGGANYPRISIKASRFRILENGTETVLPDAHLDTVIVGVNPNYSKTYYAAAWNADQEGGAPDCFSFDGIAPDPQSKKKQCDLCATCPQNAWGSNVTQSGKQLKACADQRRVAVLSADDPEGPIYLLQVTAAVLKDFKGFSMEPKRRGWPAEAVRTRISFDPNASFPKLKFEYAGFVDETVCNTVIERITSEEALIKEITGLAMVAEQGTPQAAAIPTAALETPAPQPAPQPEPTPEPEAPKRGFGVAKPAAEPANAPAEPVKEAAPAQAAAEPAKAPSTSDMGALSDEITALMAEVDDGGK